MKKKIKKNLKENLKEKNEEKNNSENNIKETLELLEEGKTKFYASKKSIVDKNMKVFYNPLMRENRELSILMLYYYFKTTKNKHIKIAFPLSSSSIRPLRFLNEHYNLILKLLEENKKIFFYINDLNKEAIRISKKNFFIEEKYKKILEHKNFTLKFYNKDANIFLLENKDFDYIEVDPFGSPNVFLNNAILSLKHKGILSITATDTAAFTGTYPKTTLRKYNVFVKKTPIMHYTALKILYSHILRLSSNYDYTMKPLLSYYDLHFIKIFLQIEKNKHKSTENMKKIVLEKICENCGNIEEKIFFKNLQKKDFVLKNNVTCSLCKNNTINVYPLFDIPLNDEKTLLELENILKNFLEEKKESLFSKKLYKKIFLIKKFSSIEKQKNILFHLHKISSYYKTSAPKNKSLKEYLEKKGFKTIQCYFDDNIIITTADYNVIKEYFEKHLKV